MVLIVLKNALSALTVIISKYALYYAQPIFYIGSRTIIAGILLLSFQYLFNYKHFVFNRKHVGSFIQIIIFQLHASYLLDIFALQYLSAAHVCILYNLSPFVSIFFSYYLFAEIMTYKKWFALILGCIGIIPMLLINPSLNSGASFISWAGLALLGAVILNTYGNIIMRDLIKNKYYSAPMATGISMLGAGILLLLTSLFVEYWSIATPIFSLRPFLSNLILSVLVGNILSYTLYGFLLQRYTVTFLSFAGFLYPIFGALFGWIFLNEGITWNFLVALIIIFAGLYFFYSEEKRQQYIS